MSALLASDDKDIILKTQEYIPKEILVKLGCIGCEWKHHAACPRYSEQDKYSHINDCWICPQRIHWLLQHLPQYKKVPSHDQVLQDLSLNLYQGIYFKEIDTLKREEEMLDRLRFGQTDAERVKSQERLVNRLKQHLNLVFKTIVNARGPPIHDAQPKITTELKVDLKPSDFLQFIKQDKGKGETLDVTPKEGIRQKPPEEGD